MEKVTFLQPKDLSSFVFTNTNSSNPNSIGLKVSSAPANWVTLLPDGLYIGAGYDFLTSQIYVSNSGDDSNLGGVSSTPVKTLKAAFEKLRTNIKTVIYLKEGDTFEWKSSDIDINLLMGKFFEFRPYGENLDNLIVQNHNPNSEIGVRIEHYYVSNQINRPTLKLINLKASSVGSNILYQSNPAFSGLIQFYGINIDCTTSNQLISNPLIDSTSGFQRFSSIRGYMSGITSGIALRFVGCIFKLHSHIPIMTTGLTSFLYLDNCVLHPDTATTGKLVKIFSASQLRLSIVGAGIAQNTPIPNSINLTYLPTTQASEYKKVISSDDDTLSIGSDNIYTVDLT